jgi:hypothetical protein
MAQPDGASSEIIFFLGAGASVEAGVPDARKFIWGQGKEGKGFLVWLFFTDRKKEFGTLSKLLRSLDTLPESKRDIEFILQLLHELNNREESFILQFFDQATFKFNSAEEIQALKDLERLLRQFIREKVLVEKEKIKYLSPLTEFPKPIVFFSVNYDTCIELLSVQHKFTYTDGFGLDWQPDSFERNFDIKLFKLHGSIIWYLTDEGNYLKLPIYLDEKNAECDGKIKLISDEEASPFILYPMGNKGEFAEPLDIISSKFQMYLKNAKVCIVVGYSFRDEDIRRIFFEISKQNETLTIILISPDAGKIYENRLKFFDDEKQILSPLSNKVICWNYPFGAALKDYHLLRCSQTQIPEIKASYELAKNDRRVGKVFENQFKKCIEIAISIDDLVTIEDILEKELGIRPHGLEFDSFFRQREKFRILYSLAILHLLNSNDGYKKYVGYFVHYLGTIKIAGEELFELFKKFKLVMDKINKQNKNNENRFNEEFAINDLDLVKERDDIKHKIQKFKNASSVYSFSFFYWSENKSDFFEAIKEFEDFIHERIKLRGGIQEYSDLLKDIEINCQKILEIWRPSGKYKDSEKVEMDGVIIEVEKLQDLTNQFNELIETFNKYVNKEK